MSIAEQVEIVESNLAEYGVCDITIEEYRYLKHKIRADAIDETIERIKQITKKDIVVIEKLNLDDIAEQLKEQE